MFRTVLSIISAPRKKCAIVDIVLLQKNRFENYFEFSKAFAIAIFAIFAIGNWHMKKVPIYVLPSKLRQTIFFL